VEILLELDIFEDDPGDILNAQSRAEYNKHFNVLLLMIKKNYTYPLCMAVNEYPDELKDFIKISEEMHEAILAKNIEKVAKLVDENPEKRHFYSKSNESALKVALNKKYFNIYEVLLAHDVIFGPHEQFSNVFGKLSENEKTILRKVHFEYSKCLPENHINVLMMNTHISHDDPDKEGKEKLVLRAYNVLNKEPLLNPILKIVAASKHFGIIFDFKRNSVELLDPTAAPNTRGLFYVDGKICIGAKQLLDTAIEHETFGTLAHELCHYAINLTFKNRAKPYFKNDQQNKDKYKEIVQFCRENRDKEEIISFVFDYEQHLHSAELIVRVAHLLALYHNQPDKLAELREIFSNLFNFHSQIVLPAIEKALPYVKSKADKEISEKKKKISKLTLLLYLSIGLGIVITCLASWYFYKPTYEFNKLSKEHQMHVQNAIVNYKNVEVKLCYLFPVNSFIYEKLTSDHISKLLDNQILNFNDSQLHYLDELVSFNWQNLTAKLKQKFINSVLHFQGKSFKFRKLNESYYKAFNALTSKQIITVLDEKEIFIGKKLECEVDFYVERKFVPEDAKMISFEYEAGHEYVMNYDTFEQHISNRTENITFQTFTNNFLMQNFDLRSQIYAKIKENVAFKGTYFDLNEEEFHFMYKNSSEMIEQIEKDRIFILSSEAGAGKTVIFKKLSIEIKNIFYSHWVSYIDLKAHINHYKPIILTTENVNELLKKIIFSNFDKNDFEVRIFEESFKSGNSVLIWNGFDEISPIYNEFILKLLMYINNNSTNIQLVCTRPLFSDLLSQVFKIRTWQLLPFDKNTRKIFFKEFFIHHNVSSENIQKHIKTTEKVIKKFESVREIFYKFENPLMLKIIAEIHTNEPLLSYGNIYEIYESFVEKKIKLWLEKSIVSHDVVSKIFLGGPLKIIFQKYALLNALNMYSTTTLGLKIRKLQIMEKNIPKKLTPEEISTLGILYINGKNEFEFSHKTFSDFFVAQYFIENVYDFDDDVNEEEAQLRLELFYNMMKSYGYVQQILTDFMSSYLQMNTKNVKKNFNSTILELLRTKFRKFFIRMLDINYQSIFKFLFEFFKKDHELFIELLHVHDNETFYTAIFNPNYFGLFISPKYIKSLAQNYLTHKEFENFITGKNQKGKTLFGMKFYQQLGLLKLNDNLEEEFNASNNTSSFWEYVYKIKENSTKEDERELFIAAINPKIYLYYENIFSVSEIFEFSDFHNFTKLWKNYKNLFSKEELRVIFGNYLINYIECNPKLKVERDWFLLFLFIKIEESLSSFEIYEMFLNRNILHEVHWDINSFEDIWNLISNHTNKDQRRKLLSKSDQDDENFYFYFMYNERKKNFIESYYYYYYDFTPFKIIHRSLIIPHTQSFTFTKNIYNEHFSKKEILEMILSSNDFFYYVIAKSEEIPEEFILFLEKLFEGNKKKVKKYFDQKVKPTNLTLYEFINDFRGLTYSRKVWFDNLKTFYSLLEKIKD